MRQLDEAAAFARLDEMLKDNSLTAIHPMIERYRFVLGWEDSGPNPKAHLEWLLSIVERGRSKE